MTPTTIHHVTLSEQVEYRYPMPETELTYTKAVFTPQLTTLIQLSNHPRVPDCTLTLSTEEVDTFVSHYRAYRATLDQHVEEGEGAQVDLAAFRSWLSVRRAEMVGIVWQGEGHPLARWLSERHGRPYTTAYGGYYIMGHPQERSPYPDWMTRLVHLLDERYSLDDLLTGEMVLAVLDEVDPPASEDAELGDLDEHPF